MLGLPPSHVVVTPVSTRASAGIAPPLSSLQLNLSVLTGVVRIAPILSLRLCEDRAHLVTVPSIFCCCPTMGSSPQVRVGFCFSSWFDVSCMLSASVLSSSASHFGVRCDIAGPPLISSVFLTFARVLRAAHGLCLSDGRRRPSAFEPGGSCSGPLAPTSGGSRDPGLDLATCAPGLSVVLFTSFLSLWCEC